MNDEANESGKHGPDDDAERELQRERRQQVRASAIGIQFVLSIAVGAFGGNWLDEKFDTAPWLLIVGIALGATAAYLDLARFARDA